MPRAQGFPSDATMRMSNDHPRDIGLTDNLMNLASLVVISRRVRDFLLARSVPSVEHLPVAILNHRGRVASPDYFIRHPIEPQDGLDLSQSRPMYNALFPTDIDFVGKLVLDPSKIDPRLDVFRLKGFGDPVITRRTLADDLVQAGFTGLSFGELSNHGQ